MPITCNRCEGTGFINLHQIPEEEFAALEDDLVEKVPLWMKANYDSDVSICDCCGNGDDWYGTPGEHYTRDDPFGDRGPYSYNGGFCECH